MAGRRWKRTFKTKALAESFRSGLLTAARGGEAFDTETGEPVSRVRVKNEMSWYDFAIAYTDMKWPTAAASYRRSIADALTTATIELLSDARGAPDQRVLRRALQGWTFNTRNRSSTSPPDVATALRWARSNCPPVSELVDTKALRAVLTSFTTRLDGGPAAATVVARKRMVFSNALDYAVEVGALTANNIRQVKWKAPEPVKTVDRRTVVNPQQARALFSAVDNTLTLGPRLVAFFALMYFAALRPEEAANLRGDNLSLPDSGWGEINLTGSSPDVGGDWTDTGRRHDSRQLKHRARGDTRLVPAPPELTAMLRSHLEQYGTDAEGRLFTAARGGPLAATTYGNVWRRARQQVFGAQDGQPNPLLARRPYDLRHAAVSTWLNAGVPPAQVAEWAGHSVEVLLRVYAKCIEGQDRLARQRVAEALGGPLDLRQIGHEREGEGG